MELTMSMFAKREHYLEAKCKQQEAALAELGHDVRAAAGAPGPAPARDDTVIDPRTGRCHDALCSAIVRAEVAIGEAMP